MNYFTVLATAKSLIPNEVNTIISGFADSIVPTVMDMLVILVPVSLAAWGIGFGVKKGLSFLKRSASQSI